MKTFYIFFLGFSIIYFFFNVTRVLSYLRLLLNYFPYPCFVFVLVLYLYLISLFISTSTSFTNFTFCFFLLGRIHIKLRVFCFLFRYFFFIVHFDIRFSYNIFIFFFNGFIIFLSGPWALLTGCFQLGIYTGSSGNLEFILFRSFGGEVFFLCIRSVVIST